MNTKSGRGSRAKGWTRLDEARSSGDAAEIARLERESEQRLERSLRKAAAKDRRREARHQRRRQREAELVAAGMTKAAAMMQAHREGF